MNGTEKQISYAKSLIESAKNDIVNASPYSAFLGDNYSEEIFQEYLIVVANAIDNFENASDAINACKKKVWERCSIAYFSGDLTKCKAIIKPLISATGLTTKEFATKFFAVGM